MKILASDYDGTLKYKEHITAEDIEAIKKWKAEGNLFVIDTGRSMESILEEAGKYNLPVDFYITNNDGMVFDKEGNVLFSSCLPVDVSHQIMTLASQMKGVVSYVVNDGWYRHRIVIDSGLKEYRYPDLLPDLDEKQVFEMNKYAQIVLSFDSVRKASAAAQYLNEQYGCQICAYANKYVTDIVPKGISKARGLLFLSNLLSVEENNIYSIGDGENDIPLMEFAGHGGCMASAKSQLRCHACYLCESVSDYIKKIG